MTGRRAFVVVLDAVGVGALPDADAYGDAGTDTLRHLATAVGGLTLPALQGLGLGALTEIDGVPPASKAESIHGRLHALGAGKDSTTGHWELMGVVASEAPPTFPSGFPPEVLAVLEPIAGRGFLCNAPYNGIAAIDDFGAEHLQTGELILYTSQDSVLQIAAHVDVLPEDELHAVCARVREELEPPVGRVIARPFRGEPGAFERTAGRRDFSLVPPSRSHLDVLSERGVAVHAVGKVDDLFTGRGIAEAHPGASNAEAIEQVTRLLGSLDSGLAFANLIETDQVFGHRKDRAGFAAALEAIDAAVSRWLGQLREGDLLVLTSDHGVDMDAGHTDHTREHALLLATGPGIEPHRHDGPLADVGATVTRWLTGTATEDLPGEPFA